jgi:hypothetical protein
MFYEKKTAEGPVVRETGFANRAVVAPTKKGHTKE